MGSMPLWGNSFFIFLLKKISNIKSHLLAWKHFKIELFANFVVFLRNFEGTTGFQKNLFFEFSTEICLDWHGEFFWNFFCEFAKIFLVHFAASDGKMSIIMFWVLLTVTLKLIVLKWHCFWIGGSDTHTTLPPTSLIFVYCFVVRLLYLNVKQENFSS